MSDFPMQLPEYDEDGQEVVFFDNLWRDIEPQTVEGLECFNPVAPINNGMNRFVLDITGEDFTKMFSALYFGAEFAYPKEFMQIIVNFLKMVHCPIDFEEECQEYPTYTPIIQYAPMNPFNNPSEIPEGYLAPPFVFVSEENIVDYGDYEIGDVLVPLDSVTLDLDWFETLDGQLPTITIQVQGSGKLALNLLVVPFGGVAVITVDNPPNLADIIVGIVTGADNIVDLNRDIVAIPPETAEHIIYPLDVVGAGMHTIYCVFLPILDDSLIPIRFGGGLRSIELCDFGEFPMGYVEDVRWQDDNFMLEQRKNGVYEPVADFQLFLDYVDNIDELANTANTNATNAQNDIIGTNIDVSFLLTKEADHETRISLLEAEMDTAQADILALQANALSQGESIENLSIDVEALEDAVEALQAAQSSAQVWSHEFDFTAGEDIWAGGADYVAGEGYLFDANENINSSGISIGDSRITYIELHMKRVSGSNIAVDFQYTPTFNSQNARLNTGAGTITVNWVQINPIPGSHSPQIKMIPAASNSFYLQKIVFWGRGADPF